MVDHIADYYPVVLVSYSVEKGSLVYFLLRSSQSIECRSGAEIWVQIETCASLFL